MNIQERLDFENLKKEVLLNQKLIKYGCSTIETEEKFVEEEYQDLTDTLISYKGYLPFRDLKTNKIVFIKKLSEDEVLFGIEKIIPMDHTEEEAIEVIEALSNERFNVIDLIRVVRNVCFWYMIIFTVLFIIVAIQSLASSFSSSALLSVLATFNDSVIIPFALIGVISLMLKKRK